MNHFKHFFNQALLLTVLVVSTFVASAQVRVFDPNDAVVIYDPAKPPVQPASGRVGKWVKTTRLSWNTTSFKCYIYNGMPFRLKYPKNYDSTKSYPMLVFLHGKGEYGKTIYDNEYQLYHGGEVHRNAVDNNSFDGFLLYPQNLSGGWGDTYFSRLNDLINNIMTSQLKIDPFRVSVNGLSAGGSASWKFMIAYPRLIASATPISATTVTFINDVNKYRHIPIWHFQGGQDAAPTPGSSRQLGNSILAAGGNYRYTEYPDQGHGCWYKAWAEKDYFPFLNRAHKANPWAVSGRTEFCPGDAVSVTLGVTAGFAAYEWRKDGVLIPGAAANQYTATGYGTYACRVKLGTTWSAWSPIPVVVRQKGATVSPPIAVAAGMSPAIPAPDGSDSVQLEAPAGYASYLWQQVGSNTVLSTTRTLSVTKPGDYHVKVAEQYGCSSEFSTPFTVINSNGATKPDAAVGLMVSPVSKTALKLQWMDNPAPAVNESNFEIYRSTTAGGAFKLLAQVPADTRFYEDADLNSNTTFFYIVRAVGTEGAAAPSNTATGTTLSDNSIPTAPRDLKITSVSRNAIALQWNEATDDVGVARYEIFINDVRSYATTETDFTVYNLEQGKHYRITVRARDASGNASPHSNQVTAYALQKGLNYKYFSGSWSVLPDFNTLTPEAVGMTPNVSISPRLQVDNFGFLWEGVINIPVSGTYTFRTNSDDGSKLYIGTYNHTAAALVSNDGAHGMQIREGTIQLNAGTYPIAITYFDATGGDGITVSWRTPLTNNAFVAIPNEAFMDAPVAGAPAPEVPSNLRAIAEGFDKIVLSWQDNSQNETGFEIFRSDILSDNYTAIGVAGSNAVSFVDTAVAPGKRYYYKIRAVNAFGESDLTYNFSEAKWGFNNDFFDATENKKTITPANNPILDGADKREGTHSVRLNGTSQYLSIPTGDGYLRDAYTEKTVAFWMKSVVTTAGQIIVDIGGSDDGLAVALDGKNLYAGVASNNVRYSITAPYTTGAWVHVALVYKANTLRLFLNGAEARSVSNMTFSTLGTTTNGSRIGQTDGSNAFNVAGVRFNGWIDGFGIYSSALNSFDIQALMGAGIGESNESTKAAPGKLPAPEQLVATGVGVSAAEVNWTYNPSTTETQTTPASIERIEAESYVQQSGVSLQTSSEGTQNVTSIGQNDYMDYNITAAVAKTYKFNFRVANTTANVQFQVRRLDGTVLATVDVPRTASVQLYTTVSANINLVAGQQTIRIFASRNSNWNFNWFEIERTAITVTNPVVNKATSVELYRTSGTRAAFQLLAVLPAQTTQYKDTALFANTVYYYKVKAVNTVSVSDFSNDDSARTANSRPVFARIADQFMHFTASLQVPLTASDADGEVLSFRAVNLPAFGSVATLANGKSEMVFNPSESDQGVYSNIMVVAYDQNQGADTITFTLTVNDNNFPVIAPVNNISVAENTVAQFSITATDRNAGDSLQWHFEALPQFATPVIEAGQVAISLKPGYADNGSYPVVAKVSDGRNGTDSVSFVITVEDQNPNRRFFINFNFGSNVTGVWNNVDKVPALNAVVGGFKDDKGVPSNMGIKVTSVWQGNGGTNTTGAVTGNSTGLFPDAVMRTAWWSNTTKQSFNFTGLDTARMYNFTFFGSRGGVSDDRTTVYTVNATRSVSLNTANNVSNTVNVSNVKPNADGTVSIDMKNGPLTTFGYLNAMVVESVYDDLMAPAAPRALVGVFGQGAARLQWTDAAFNEAAYEVHRATALNGDYSLLNPGTYTSNLTAFADSSVAANGVYFYKVRCINQYGSSEFSATVKVEVPNKAPVLQPLAVQRLKSDQIATLGVTALDDTGDQVAITAVNLPAFATLVQNGNGSAAIRFAPDLNHVGVYNNIIIRATDNFGSTSSQALTVFVSNKNLVATYVNFNQVSPQDVPWNNFNSLPNANQTLADVKDELGERTGMTVTLVDRWEGVNDFGSVTGSNTGIFPDNVMRTAYYESSTAVKRVRLSGLSASKKYNLIFFSSRTAADVRITNFTINGKTIALDAASNTQKTAQFNGVAANENGVIEVSIAKDATSPFAYINALQIQAYENDGSLLAPTNLTATGIAKSQINLSWSDNSESETGFEIYRAGTANGNYTLLATTAANATSYTDGGLSGNTTYFYKVRARNDAQLSVYSNTAGSSTFSHVVMVSMNETLPAASPWNNTNALPQVGLLLANMRNDEGNPSGMSLSIVNNFTGINELGMVTGNNSGIYPDNVIRSTYYCDKGVTAKIRVAGLNQAMEYNFVFFGSRDGGGDRTSVYTIGNKSVSLNCSFNTSKTVQLNHIRPDENGSVEIEISLGSIAQYAYLGALAIQGYNAADTTGSAQNQPQATIPPVTTKLKATTRAVAATVPQIEAESKASASIEVFPNPFHEDATLKLKLDNNVPKLTVSIIDMSGKLMMRRAFNNVSKGTWQQALGLQQAALKPGVYLVQIAGVSNHKPLIVKLMKIN